MINGIPAIDPVRSHGLERKVGAENRPISQTAPTHNVTVRFVRVSNFWPLGPAVTSQIPAEAPIRGKAF